MNQYGKEILNALGLEQEEVIASFNGEVALRRPKESTPFVKVVVRPDGVKASFGDIVTDAPVRVMYG